MAADLLLVVPFILVGAFLYSSVGHGGATVYLAVLTLAGFAVSELVTTVLVLNILAASIAFLMFSQAGHLRLRLLLPFVVTSVPAAYLGGFLPLSGTVQGIILAAALALGGLRLLLFPTPPRIPAPQEGPAFIAVALVLGAVLGFLAGATGIGGGIFLSPLLLAFGWTDVRGAGSVASAFIVLNSLAALAAKLPRTPLDLGLLGPLAVTVCVGAVAGSFLGARRFPSRALQVLLGVVLLVAALKAVI
ncbi:MAG TPA: sulfite exporter TauE/SafE family protein [Candidatus Thermoplasmatota archaeon]|nr:sulfite exporter TauE/SafE family protein [Candidatus Thermoplasmatota archaeon]